MNITLSDGLLVLILGGLATAIWRAGEITTILKSLKEAFTAHVASNAIEHEGFREDIDTLRHTAQDHEKRITEVERR